MSNYQKLSHYHKSDTLKLPLYRPLDDLVDESMKHKRTVVSIVIVVFSITFIYLGMSYYQSRYQEKAADLLQRDPKAVLAQYPRSDAAVLAGVKLGEAALKNSQWDDAIFYYKLLSEKKSIPAIVRVGASQNLALAYLNKGEKEIALQTLLKIEADPENIQQDYTKLLEAHVWEAKGDEAKAQTLYQQISEGAVSNEIKEEAKARLKEVK